MGVPKFFRWLSERYPLINQPIHCPPLEETKKTHGFPPSAFTTDEDYSNIQQLSSSSSGGGGGDSTKRDARRNTNLPHIMPEFDRLYLDMNGIIHCASHNNSEEELEKQQQHQQNINSLNDDSNPPMAEGTTTTNNGEANLTTTARATGGGITEEQIFQNVCYYLDRIISDIVQPKELVYLAIDGVAPRAKMNQQRSRRYRSGSEQEIEMHLMTLQRAAQEGGGVGNNTADGNDGYDGSSREYIIEADGGGDDGYWWEDMPHSSSSSSAAAGVDQKGVSRGAKRFTGTIEASSSSATSSSSKDAAPSHACNEQSSSSNNPYGFHSNCITPGTPFLHNCSQRIVEYVRHKLKTDPKWHDLTIVFSGHDVPGEGEHKIMDFIRHEKHKPGYNPNTRHCIYGQDGDLIMLGLATHEPHCCLLREEVVFDPSRKKVVQLLAKLEHEKQLEGSIDGESDYCGDESSASQSNQPPLSAAIQSYIHNPNFELLHLSVLRDYLALEFETTEFNPSSKFRLEPTIDDFVFMTFFVGNDFLPHMPALDIGDEAFDLLFYAYKKNRGKWMNDGLYRRSVKSVIDGGNIGESQTKTKTFNHPYLTDAGTITSGDRLEAFLTDVGGYEDPYYDNKRFSKLDDNERMRKADKKAGRESLIPSQDVLDQVEAAGRELYKEMLLKNSLIEEGASAEEEDYDEDEDFDGDDVSTFKPVTSTRTMPEIKVAADGNEMDPSLIKKLGGILRGSLSTEEGGASKSVTIDENALVDLKGRYYYDKFRYSPFDSEKHLALRKAYISGLVWNLEYYYKGCVSWEWYYPYYYGPMLSDLVNINSILSDISFFDEDKENNKGSASSNNVNGVRQVAGEPLCPFEQLLGCLPPSSSYLLPEPYRWLMTSPESPLIDTYPESFTVDMNGKRWPWEAVTLLPFIDAKKLSDATRSLIDESLLTEDEKRLNQFGETYVLSRSSDRDGVVKTEVLDDSQWARIKHDADVAFQPELSPGVVVPSPCFPTLKDAPVYKLSRRKLGINVFGLRSRYRTALLEMSNDLPPLPSAALLAQKFIGTTVYFRYPFLHEGFVCSVADSLAVYRGKDKPRKYSEEIRNKRQTQLAKLYKQFQVGEGTSGTGGWVLPPSDITLTVRPLKCIETMPDGTKVKVFSREEVEIPFVAALWSPSRPDPRLDNLPLKLEKNPFRFGNYDSRENTLAHSDGVKNVPSFGIGKLQSGSSVSNASSSSAVASNRGFSTLVPMRSPMISPFNNTTKGHQLPAKACPPHRSFCSRPITLRAGDPRRRVLGTAGAMAISAFFFATCLCHVSAIFSIATRNELFAKVKVHQTAMPALFLRGGDIEQDGGMFDMSIPSTPPIEFAHGTTTISFVFQGGIVAAVDSRASIGNFVGSKTTQKVLPVSRHVLGTMAGGAADCSFWIRYLRSEAKLHELFHDGRGISVARASKILSNLLYQNRGLDLSVGTMIMGHHPRDGFGIYYVDNTGVRIKGDMFAVGSGSTFALGILDTKERRFDMTEDEAVALGIKAIRHATLRDAMSGGYIGVYLVTKHGWQKVFSEDLASITN